MFFLEEERHLVSTKMMKITITTQNDPTCNKDVLLPHPGWSEVCKHKSKRRLYEGGYILSTFEMRKSWDCRTFIVEIKEAFKDRIPQDVRYFV